MSKFKAGDKVYYPSSCGIVFTVEDSKNVLYPLMVDQTCIKESGLLQSGDRAEVVFHATKESHAALSTLFPEIEFELPPLTSNEIVQNMLKEGKPVMCYLSDDSYDMAVFKGIYGLVASYDADEGFDAGGSFWQYVVPMKKPDVLSKIAFCRGGVNEIPN